MISTLLWLDFETTGLDLNRDHILEVAWVLTDFDLNPIVGYQSVVCPPIEGWPERMLPFVRKMHMDNGLLQEISSMKKPKRLLDIELETEYELDLTGADTSLMYLAGSGVSHFDYLWIQKFFPTLARRLHYAQLDISVVRRTATVLGLDNLFKPRVEEDPSQAHRAMFDVKNAITEAQYFRDILHPMFGVAAAKR